MRQLSRHDSRLLNRDVSHGNRSSTGVYVYDPSALPGGELSFDDILDHIERRLHTSPIFSRKLVEVPFDLDRPYWVTDEYFELEDHVRHVALPKPGNWQQFCTLVARIHSRPLDLSRPLWELYVVEGLDRIAKFPVGSFAILTKVHHAAIGRETGAEIMAGLHDFSAQSETPAPSFTCVSLGLVPVALAKSGSGRKISFFRRSLHTEIADPLERLTAISQESASSDYMGSAISARELMDINQYSPSETLALASRTLSAKLAKNVDFQPLAHCCITNVPGTQKPLFLKGAKMVYASGLAPLSDGLGLVITANSYNGRLHISPTSCREILPHIDEFVQYLDDSYAAFQVAASRPEKKIKRDWYEVTGIVRDVEREGEELANNRGEHLEPQLLHTLLEGRVLAELAAFPLTLPLLRGLPRGDGHPVMVLPGFSADDTTTKVLRYFLKKQGYSVQTWGFRRNTGLAGNIEERVAERVKKLAQRSGRKVSLVGHSLGGLISRYVAHDLPDCVRQVITVGSPNGLDPKGSNVSNFLARSYGAANPEIMIRGANLHMTKARLERWHNSPMVPLTSIYSRTDGIVHWSSCLDPEDHEFSQNVRVPSSHIGMVHHPMTLWVIADRLAQPEGEWRAFREQSLYSLWQKLLNPLELLL